MKSNIESNEFVSVKKLSVLKMICYAFAFTFALLVGEYVVRVGVTLWNEILRTAELIFQNVFTFEKVAIISGASLAVAIIILVVNRILVHDAEVRKTYAQGKVQPAKKGKFAADNVGKVRTPAAHTVHPVATHPVSGNDADSTQKEIYVFQSNAGHEVAERQAM